MKFMFAQHICHRIGCLHKTPDSPETGKYSLHSMCCLPKQTQLYFSSAILNLNVFVGDQIKHVNRRTHKSLWLSLREPQK